MQYNYWNQKSRRMDLAVLDLYEGGFQSKSSEFSSFHPPPQPIVRRLAYICPGHLSTMAVTITEKGIASKELLCKSCHFFAEWGSIIRLIQHVMHVHAGFRHVYFEAGTISLISNCKAFSKIE